MTLNFGKSYVDIIIDAKYAFEMKPYLDFLTKSRKKTAYKRLINALAPMMNLRWNFDHWNRVADGKNRNGEQFIIIADLKSISVNKELVKEYAEYFDGNRHEFPKFARLSLKRGDTKNIYFTIHSVNCSPNWNHESEVVKAIPLNEIDVPIINNLNGIERIAGCVAKCLTYETEKKIGVDFPNYGMKPNKEQLAELISKGMKCVYRRGWAYRGAKATPITTEKALEMLPKYNYGKGFYELDYSVSHLIPTLEFNELSELDME